MKKVAKKIKKPAKKKNSSKSEGATKLSHLKRDARSAKKVSNSWAMIKQDIWPQERDFMARPDRLKYVRKLIKTNGCVFCEANQKGPSAESLCVYKNDLAMIILNKYPYNSGHVLVLPTQHSGDLTELNDETYFEMQRLIRRVVNIIKQEYSVQGINIGLNMGAIAGAGIPEHLHWHVIPRWQGDTNFFPLIAETKVLAQTVEEVYARYSKYDFSKDK